MTRAPSMPRHSKPTSASWAPARRASRSQESWRGRRFSVVVLESGGFEFHHRPQLLYLGANVGLPSYSIARSRFRFFGGSTTRWGKQCRPLDAIDFEARPGIDGSGWPLTLAELEPYYRRAQQYLRTGGIRLRATRPGCPAARTTSVSSPSSSTHGSSSSATRATLARLYRDELSTARNVRVYLNANVVDIDRAGDRVTGVRVATFNGRRVAVTVGAVVLACGGIENARLLLAAGGGASGGIGNEHDLVGRYFMDHPYFLAGHFEAANPRHSRSALCDRGLRTRRCRTESQRGVCVAPRPAACGEAQRRGRVLRAPAVVQVCAGVFLSGRQVVCPPGRCAAPPRASKSRLRTPCPQRRPRLPRHRSYVGAAGARAGAPTSVAGAACGHRGDAQSRESSATRPGEGPLRHAAGRGRSGA